MRKNRIKLYWLLLLIMILTATTVQSVGTTQARYNNTVTAVAVIEAPAKDITSNCLVTANDPSRTVLLGEIDLEETMEVPFWLLSSGTDASVKLNWGVSDPEHAQYFNIAVLIGSEKLEPGEEIALLKDLRLDLKMSLIPTEIASGTAHEETKVNVHVTVGDDMWGTFQVILPAVEGLPIVSGNDADSSVSGSDADSTVSDNDVDPIVIDDDANPTEVGNDEDATDSDSTATFTVSGNDAVNKYEEQEALIALKTLTTFDTTQQLPVWMTLADHITSARLGIQIMSEDVDSEDSISEATDQEDIAPGFLPDYTMFSVDGGAGYYMLYGDFIPEFVLHEITSVPLLMDFSYTQLEQDEELTIVMEAYRGDRLRKTCTADTVAVVRQNQQTMSMQDTTKMLGPVLNFDNILEFNLSQVWEEVELQYSVEYLTMTEEQVLQYVPVELADDGLQATYIKEEDSPKMVLKLGRKFTQPGTYRINISRSYQGICYDTMQTSFFVNCSGREEAMASGLEVSQ